MFDAKQLIARLGMEDYRGADALLSRNPSTGEVLAGVRLASRGDY